MGGIIFKNAGDDFTGEVVSTSVITALIASLNVGLIYNKGELMRKTLKGEEIDPAEKLRQIRSTNFVVNLTMIATMLNRYYLFNKKIEVPVTTFPLKEAKLAQEMMVNKKHIGKIVLTIEQIIECL